MKKHDLPIGIRFRIKDMIYIVKDNKSNGGPFSFLHNPCDNCDLSKICINSEIIGNIICSPQERKDGKSVYFKRIGFTKNEDGNYDLPIGTKFRKRDKKYIVKKLDDGNFLCGDCSGIGSSQECYSFPECRKVWRKDKTSVIFKEIE